jgi:uncharacterized protein YjiS (DUF1127 family)
MEVARDAWAWLAQCGETVSQRRVLAELTDWQLRDLGISRAEADAEGRSGDKSGFTDKLQVHADASPATAAPSSGAEFRARATDPC